MARNLKTGWVTIATSGPVVHGKEDGRFIKKEWLQDMADTYNTKVFTAKLWPEHQRYFSAGTVLSLKVEPATEPELAGELQLFAILSPSDWLLTANAAGDYTFPSIEVGENYRGTGKFFLKGLGLTDDPASAGVTELKFSNKDGEQKALVFSGHQFDLNTNLEKTDSLVKRIFGLAGTTEPNQETDTMNEAQLKAMQESISASITASFGAMQEVLVAALKPPASNNDVTDGNGNEGEGEEHFSAKKLQEENTALKQRVDSLESQFKSLSGSPDGQNTPTPEGEGDGGAAVVI